MDLMNTVVELVYVGWTNNGRGSVGRNTNLKNYAASKGKPWQDGDIQIEFLVGEITRTGDAVAYTGDELSGSHRSGWENATSVDDATIHFCLGFERCAEWAYYASQQKRITAAHNYYNQFHGKQAPDSGSDKDSSNSPVVKEARGALGVPYVWGGESYTGGMDCSGLVKVCYQRAYGISLPHYTGSLMTDSRFRTVGSIDQLKGGDIIVSANHVGIYTGAGTVIHEPQPRRRL